MTWSEGKAYLEQNLQNLVTCRIRGLQWSRAETDTPPAPRPPAGSALCWGRGVEGRGRSLLGC